jgi:hypothetical protein
MKKYLEKSCVLIAALVAVFLAAPISAQPLGMVVDHTTDTVTVFDDATGLVLGSVAVPGGSNGDCSITGDGSTGFATNFLHQVSVIDLTGPVPVLAPGPNPILVSNPGEDTSISPDGQFLVVCDGGIIAPISVVDIATQTEISTFALGTDCNSVDVCSDGSVLVTSSIAQNVRRLTLDGAGNLADTGDVLAPGGQPNNAVCGPDATSGVVITRDGSMVTSFSIPLLLPVSVQAPTGIFGISLVIDPAGSTLFTRSNFLGTIDAYNYADATGTIGAPLYPPIPITGALPLFGMDQMALNLANSKLYVSQPGSVDIFDPATGGFLGSIVDPNIVAPTGICFPSLQDQDGDGVPDDLDVCPVTVIPEANVPSHRLGTNRWVLSDGDGIFDTNLPVGIGPDRSYTIDDTAGCSCEQIIAEQDLGEGHLKFGCSISAMDDWVSLVNP